MQKVSPVMRLATLRRERSPFAELVALLNAADSAPDVAVDVVAGEPDRAVAEHDVAAAGVVAADSSVDAVDADVTDAVATLGVRRQGVRVVRRNRNSAV